MQRFPIVVASLVVATSAYAADILQPIAAETVVTPHISGYGELYLGGLRFPDGNDDTVRAGGGAGRVNIPFAGRWNLQGDLTYDRIWQDDFHLDGTGAAIHGYYRDPDNFAAGVFAAYKSYGSNFLRDVSVYDYQVGPEAQVYLGNLTLYGQAYYGQFTFDSEHFDIERFGQWGVRGVARYFVQKNFRLDAELDFHRTAAFFDEDMFDAAVQATYRFDDTPWSLFGRYQFERTTVSASGYSSHAFLIGMRASFGSNSLLDEDRNGATMDTMRPNGVRSFGG
jgi:hypothetical protein